MLARLASDGATALHGLRRQLAEEEAVGAEGPRAQNIAVGVVAFLVATSCSSFAGVYVELMLTGGDKPSLWLRNIQLAVYSSIAATIGLASTASGNPMFREGGFFYGLGFWAWTAILWQAVGGILVAVVIKHAGNILRCFASGLAIVIAGAGGWLLFDHEIKLTFVVGVAFVVIASCMYVDPARTPAELHAKWCGRHRQHTEAVPARREVSVIEEGLPRHCTSLKPTATSLAFRSLPEDDRWDDERLEVAKPRAQMGKPKTVSKTGKQQQKKKTSDSDQLLARAAPSPPGSPARAASP
mmetsp:Transcript_30847/g.52798  ORF Transcript_30847/g.52798 Transcript_30847/m.52798 type:complete len:298 (-) Transcript_30847:240-1133(-)